MNTPTTLPPTLTPELLAALLEHFQGSVRDVARAAGLTDNTVFRLRRYLPGERGGTLRRPNNTTRDKLLALGRRLLDPETFERLSHTEPARETAVDAGPVDAAGAAGIEYIDVSKLDPHAHELGPGIPDPYAHSQQLALAPPVPKPLSDRLLDLIGRASATARPTWTNDALDLLVDLRALERALGSPNGTR